MPGMVTSIVESLKYLTPMAFDVMSFAVLKQLASPKKKLKVGGQRPGCCGSGAALALQGRPAGRRHAHLPCAGPVSVLPTVSWF